MAVGINILTDFDSRGISKAIAEFKKLETSTEKASFALKKAFLPAVAVLGGLAFAGFKAAEAAAADELEQAKLAQTLEKVVGASSATVASTEELIKSMSRASGTADTELRAALASLVIGTKDLTKAQEGLALAQDISTASGVPLQAAADALAKAYAGNFKALQKLSPALRDLIKDGASTEAIFADLANTFSGATANAADTAAGKMKILKNNVAEFQESLGAALLPALEKITSVMTVVFGFMADNEKIVLALAGAVGFLALAIVAYNIALKVATIVNVAFGASATAAAAAAAPLAAFAAVFIITIVALAAAVVLAYQRFEVFRDIVRVVFNGLIQIVEVFVNLFVAAWNVVVNVINAAITVANFFGADLKKLGTVGWVSLGRVSEASEMTEQQLKNLERQALNTAGAVRMIVTPENQLKTQSDRYTEMALSMGKFVDYTGKGYKQISSGGGVVESASDKLKKYVDAIKGVTSAQRSLRDANKSVNESNQNLLEKTKALTEAQKRFNLVTKGYGKESKETKDAESERSKAERAAERAKYALEEAIFAVKDAEAELVKIRKDPESTPQMIREAEIKLAQAKLSVADATDQQRDSVEALTAAQEKLDVTINGVKEGSDAYNEVLKELKDAEKEQTDAIYSRVEAYERLKDATEALTEAEKERSEAGKKITKAQKAAADANAGVVVPDFSTGDGGGGATGNTGFDFGFGEITFEDLKNIRVPTLEELIGGGMGTFADGGIVTKAMLGLVGEAGAEAIIPLDRMNDFASPTVVTINVQSGIVNGAQVGQEIYEYLRDFERINGPLNLGN